MEKLAMPQSQVLVEIGFATAYGRWSVRDEDCWLHTLSDPLGELAYAGDLVREVVSHGLADVDLIQALGSGVPVVDQCSAKSVMPKVVVDGCRRVSEIAVSSRSVACVWWHWTSQAADTRPRAPQMAPEWGLERASVKALV